MYTRNVPELPADVPHAGRLGRNVHHDERSRGYTFATEGLPLVSAQHRRSVPVFDQGSIGSCTGNAALGCLGTDPYYSTMSTDVAFQESFAVQLYSEFTRNDPFDGAYPPDDTGSDGLTAAKVLQAHKWISGYQHIFGGDAARRALGITPFIAGINWYSSFDRPDANGVIAIGSQAYVRGGHEIVFDQIDVEKLLLWFTNSWSLRWGLNGKACMSFDTFDRLLAEQGDVTIFTPNDQPAPKPTASAEDVTLYASMKVNSWITNHTNIAAAARAWAVAKGLRAAN